MASPLRRLLPVPLLVLALAAAGCGDEKTSKDVAGGGSTTTTAAQGATDTTATDATGATTPEASAGTGASSGKATPIAKIASQVGTDVDSAPKVPKTSGTPPTTVEKRDVVKGKGTAAKVGDQVDVRYTLAVWAGGKVQSSWDMGKDPVPLTLSQGNVIDGWVDTIPGMKPGGRRVLVIPADKGYGDSGTPDGSIPPGATLVFVVDLVKAS